jgi:2,3-dihydroxybenzoate decarboxylase
MLSENRVIALEEHFDLEETASYGGVHSGLLDSALWTRWQVLLRSPEQHLRSMDEAGIDLSLLSLTSPGVQGEPDARRAVTIAAHANDALAGLIAEHPTRFGGFAAVPVQDPVAAADELERAVTELGLRGAMINGTTHDGEYLDGERFLPFWERVAALGVPVYLHPGIVTPTPTMFGQYPQLYGAMWGWGVDTATHALRLVLSGLFDRLPGLTIVLGHMGEHLPFSLWRLDSRYAVVLGGARLARRPSEYLRANFMVTTSGACSREPLRCTIDALGADRVMFATDYPYEDAIEATRFLGTVDVTDDERAAIAHGNAEKAFGL